MAPDTMNRGDAERYVTATRCPHFFILLSLSVKDGVSRVDCTGKRPKTPQVFSHGECFPLPMPPYEQAVQEGKWIVEPDPDFFYFDTFVGTVGEERRMSRKECDTSPVHWLKRAPAQPQYRHLNYNRMGKLHETRRNPHSLAEHAEKMPCTAEQAAIMSAGLPGDDHHRRRKERVHGVGSVRTITHVNRAGSVPRRPDSRFKPLVKNLS